MSAPKEFDNFGSVLEGDLHFSWWHAIAAVALTEVTVGG